MVKIACYDNCMNYFSEQFIHKSSQILGTREIMTKIIICDMARST